MSQLTLEVFTGSDAEARQAWLETLDQLEALHPEVVVAGRQASQAPNSPDAIAHTRDYLVAFDEVLSQSPTAEQIVAAMKSRFPSLKTMEIALTLGAKAAGENHAHSSRDH